MGLPGPGCRDCLRRFHASRQGLDTVGPACMACLSRGAQRVSCAVSVTDARGAVGGNCLVSLPSACVGLFPAPESRGGARAGVRHMQLLLKWAYPALR